MKEDKKHGTYQQREGQEPTIEWDEITSQLDARYVSAPEATWRIFHFPLSHRSHNIIRLAVHLPREESVFFYAGTRRKCTHQSCNERHYFDCLLQTESQ